MFEITAEDIALLTDADLRELVGQLCEAEMRARGLSTSFVMSGGDQDAPDGGVDVSVNLPAAAQVDGWVPRPATGFQVKKQKMPRASIIAEMRPKGMVRPVIRELADSSGAYIIVSSKDSTSDTALKNRLNAMAGAVQDLANADALKLDFYDRRRLATWVRDHPGLVAWVRNKIGRPLQGWRPYGAWADTSEGVSGDYMSDGELRIHVATGQSADGLPALEGVQQIRDLLRQPGTVARLVGLSGVGKTRLVQALFEKGVGGEILHPADALYANVADSPDPQPVDLASQLIAKHDRAILVIDNCPPELHRRLSQVCRVPESTVSVISIEYDIKDDLPEETEVFRLDTSSRELIERLIRRRYREVSETDVRTISTFSDGNASVAIALARSVGAKETIEGLKDEELLKRLVWQRNLPDPALWWAAQACSLVYSFDVERTDSESELARLGALVGQDAQEMYRNVAVLKSRGLVQQRSNWRAILPHAIANRLASIALQNCAPSAIAAQLVDGVPERLLKSFSRRLGYLDSSAEAVAIASRWLEVGGMLGDVTKFSDIGKAIFENVAPVAPEAALKALERCVAGLDNRTDYVRILRSLAYDAELFPRCIAVLTKCAIAGDLDGRRNFALDAFTSLFQLCYSGTLAAIEQRLDVINPLLISGKTEECALGLKALKATLEAVHFRPFHEFDFGARSRNYGYWPNPLGEVRRWFGLTLKFTTTLVCGDGPVASGARVALAQQLRGIWTVAGAYDEIEESCRAIAEKRFWPEGWRAVRQIQHYDGAGFKAEIAERIEALEALLRPKDLIQRVRSFVLSDDVSGIHAIDPERHGVDAVNDGLAELNTIALDLGKSVALDELAFDEVLPELLSLSYSGQLWPFGEGLARGADDLVKTWKRLVDGIASIPEGQRNFAVLSGFLHTLDQTNRELVATILDSAVEDETLASMLPALQSAAGIDQRGVDRLMNSLSLGLTPIERYRWLSLGRVTDSIPSEQFRDLVLAIASKAGGFDVATDILNMRLHSDQQEKLEHPEEILAAGRELIRQVHFAKPKNNMLDYHLGQISRSCLGGNEGEAVVREVFRRLKDAVASNKAHAFDFDDLIGGMFAIQPTAALDALCGGKLEELGNGLRMIGDFHRNPLDCMPASEVFAWCEHGSASRYPGIAGAITISHEPKAGEPPLWTTLSLQLLDSARDRIAVVKQYIVQIEKSWNPWSVATLAKNLSLLDKLIEYPDVTVARFVSEERVRLGKIVDAQMVIDEKAEKERDERFEW